MAGFRVDWPHDQGVDSNSTVQSGAKFFVYENETVILKTLYSDRDVLVTRANPVVADAAGRFDVAYVADDDLLTLVLKTSADVDIDSWDDIEPEVSTDLAALAAFLPLAGGTMTGAIRFKEGAAINSATSINADASGGNVNHIAGTTTIGTITLAEGAMRWFVFDGALTLTHSANLLLGGVDIVTHANMVLVFLGEGAGVTRLVGGMTASGKSIVESFALIIGVGDETTAIAAGTNKRRFRAPFALTVTAARDSLSSAQASGDLVTVDVNNDGNSIFSTVLTIDNNELTSTTATTPPVLNPNFVDVANDAIIDIDIDDCDPSTAAAGLKVTLLGYKFNLS